VLVLAKRSALHRITQRDRRKSLPPQITASNESLPLLRFAPNRWLGRRLPYQRVTTALPQLQPRRGAGNGNKRCHRYMSPGHGATRCFACADRATIRLRTRTPLGRRSSPSSERTSHTGYNGGLPQAWRPFRPERWRCWHRRRCQWRGDVCLAAPNMPLGERALSEGLSGIAWSSFQSAVERHRGDRDRRACRQILQSSAPIPSKLLEALQGAKLASTFGRGGSS